MAAHWNVQPRYHSYGTALHEISRVEGLSALYNGWLPVVEIAERGFLTILSKFEKFENFHS